MYFYAKKKFTNILPLKSHRVDLDVLFGSISLNVSVLSIILVEQGVLYVAYCLQQLFSIIMSSRANLWVSRALDGFGGYLFFSQRTLQLALSLLFHF
jgi:hypothetical protein